MTQGGRGCWLSWENSWGEQGQVSRRSAPSSGPASIAPDLAHQDTVLPSRFRGNGADVGQLGCAQGAEEAGLAVFMACEEAVIGDHQAAGDAGAGSYPLGDDLKGMGRGAGETSWSSWCCSAGAQPARCPSLQWSGRLRTPQEHRWGWGDSGSVQATGGPEL